MSNDPDDPAGDAWEACLWLSDAEGFDPDPGATDGALVVWSDAEDADERRLFDAIKAYGRTVEPGPLAKMLPTATDPAAAVLAPVFQAMRQKSAPPRYASEIDYRFVERLGPLEVQGKTVFQFPAEGAGARQK